MSVLDRSELAESPLADLHAIASELGVDGFRRLRRDDLVDAILAHQGGAPASAAADADEDERPRRRRGGRGRSAAVVEDDEPVTGLPEPEPEAEAPRRRRGRGGEERTERPAARERGGRDRDRDERPARDREERPARDRDRAERPAAREAERTAEGVVELQPNGSAFMRVDASGPSDDDVYLSAAQVRRCELVDGDRVSGPVRPPRRSERFASLVRVESINGASADQVSEGVRYDELPSAFPAERLALDADDPTLKAIEFLTPFGRGSRVTLVGGARAGKSEALRRIAAALSGTAGIELAVVLAGVRPEEIAEWSAGPVAPAAALSFAASADAQAQAVEGAIESGKRVAARGGHAVVLLDTLDGLSASAARKALAAARNLVAGGSLTVIATASAPLGGETTVVAFDAQQAAAGRFPALDLLTSGTLRAELLVGAAGAAAIAEAHAEAAE